MTPAVRALLAETIGTFMLVFAGTGAIIVNDLFPGTLGHPGIAATFGLVVMTGIYAFGETSGAHFNPAVTLAFAATRRFSWRELPAYWMAQCLGALAASLLLHTLFPLHQGLGTTLPAAGVPVSFIFELFMSAWLLIVILSVATGAKEKGLFAGLAIGGTVTLEALFGGPVSGASMNPARSLAPALVSGQFEHLWIYLLAPALGALLAVPLCRCTDADCCRAPEKMD